MLARALGNGRPCPSSSFVCLRCELRSIRHSASSSQRLRSSHERAYSSSPSAEQGHSHNSNGAKSSKEAKNKSDGLSFKEKKLFKGERLPPGFLVRQWRKQAKQVFGDDVDWPEYLRTRTQKYNERRAREASSRAEDDQASRREEAAVTDVPTEVKNEGQSRNSTASMDASTTPVPEQASGDTFAIRKIVRGRAKSKSDGTRPEVASESPEQTFTLKEALLKSEPKSDRKALRDAKLEATLSHSVDVSNLELRAIDVPHPPVPQLSYGLDRVLFNQGVCRLRDPRTRVFNFDPYLEKVIPIEEFDFDTLSTFMTPSSDPELARIAKEENKKFVSSTSSMTGLLKHFHFLLSRFRPLNLSMLSRSFPTNSLQMTAMSRSPDAVFLHYRDGSYAVDADKQYDSANVLSMMGKFMEKLLTISKEDFEKHKIGQSHQLEAADKDVPEAFHYSTLGDFVIRSQLDAHDPRLPGRGIFDLKTRAVLPVRMDTKDFGWGTDYEIKELQGKWESFEREFHDMARSTLLKYSLQVRLGRMDGIFVAYHNIKRIFGFQYLPLEELDQVIHGTSDTTLGGRELLLSLHLVNQVFNKAIERFPQQTIRFHFEARDTAEPFMYVFAEPVSAEAAKEIQTANKADIEKWEQQVLGRTAPSTVVTGPENAQTLDADKGGAPSKEILAAIEEGEVVVAQGHGTNDRTITSTETISEHSTPSDPHELQHPPEPQASADANETAAATIQEELTAGASTDAVLSNLDLESSSDATQPPSNRDQALNDHSTFDTESSAESGFLDDLIQTKQKNESTVPTTPLLAMIMHVNSRVNNVKVVTPPDSMTANDSWTLRYSMSEVIDGQRAWRLYEGCKARRTKAYGDDPPATASPTAPPKEDHYLNLLREITEKSRQWRAELDQRDQGQPLRMWNERK